jgi:superfamily I DNA/RNA helicase
VIIMKNFRPSTQQQAIFNFVANGVGHAVVEAKAGSGKTTTILQSMQYIPKGKNTTFLAFNTDIAKHINVKLKEMNIDATARTFHSLGWSNWKKYTGFVPNLIPFKIKNILQGKLSRSDYKLYGKDVQKLVEKAKLVGLVPEEANNLASGIVPDTEYEWMKIIKHYGSELKDIDIGTQIAKEALYASIQDKNTIDFNDMLFMPIIYNAPFFQNDVLFIDEAQDTSDIRREMAKRAIKEDGRIIAVGDRYQSIYGFAGANPDSMDLLTKDLKAEVLPLSVTYRCATSIVALAKAIVPDIQARENAPIGRIENLGESFNIQKFRDTDMILCRNAAPLIAFAFFLLRNKIACQIKGRDIGRSLISLIEKLDAQSIEELMKKLKGGCKKECNKLLAKDEEANLEIIIDKYGAIEALLEDMRHATVGDVVLELKAMFNLGVDYNDDVLKDKAEQEKVNIILTLSTVHRAKGLEAPRVYILNKELMPSIYAKKEWEKQQEKNIEYVAYTRAEKELYFIKNQ